MIATTDSFLGEPCWLLPFAPDWRAGLECRFELPADTERGLSGRESRRAYAETLRTELSYECLLNAEQASTLRNALQTMETEQWPIWFPFWPAMEEPESFSAPRFLDVGKGPGPIDGAQLVDSADAPLEEGRVRVAALRGYFSGRPRLEALTDEVFVARFQIREDSPPEFALQVTSPAAQEGPAIGGESVPVIPVRPQWRRGLGTGSTVFEVDSREIGFSRQRARVIYPQRPERTLRMEVDFMNAGEIAALVGFFADAAGSTQAFWAPTWMADVRLAGPVPAASSDLPVESTTGLGENTHIAVIAPNSGVSVHEIIGKEETSLSLGSALESALDPQRTSITTAALVRFARPALSVHWKSSADASATVELRECTSDVLTLEGEEQHVSIGALPRACFLYRFSVQYPSLTRYWTHTSYEQPMQFEGALYTPRPIEHGDLRETLNLERNEIELRTHAFAENPLQLFVPFRLEFPLVLEIFEATVFGDPPSPGNPLRVFSGEITRVSMDGPFLNARAVTVGNLFERKVPRVLLQTGCNFALFDGGCGLEKGHWRHSGEFVAQLTDPVRLRVRGLLRGASAVGIPPDHWFAGGWVECGSEATLESRFIADSRRIAQPDGADELELELGAALWSNPQAGDTVTFYPGCNGKASTCRDKFANFDRFGGMPHMPVGNPSMVKMPANRNVK